MKGEQGKVYSGKQIIRAGEKLIRPIDELSPDEFQSAMDTLSYWRISHEDALDKAFQTLQDITKLKDRKAIFARRLKRYDSIVKKLKRF